MTEETSSAPYPVSLGDVLFVARQLTRDHEVWVAVVEGRENCCLFVLPTTKSSIESESSLSRLSTGSTSGS